MMVYADRSFCSQKCANESCDRCVTKKVIERGTKWWGSPDFPIALSDYKTDTCGFIPKEVTE